MSGRVEVCKLLVESQADVNAKDGECDARPLHMLLETKGDCGFVLNVVTPVFFSVETLHCILLLKTVTWSFASSWSKVMLM